MHTHLVYQQKVCNEILKKKMTPCHFQSVKVFCNIPMKILVYQKLIDYWKVCGFWAYKLGPCHYGVLKKQMKEFDKLLNPCPHNDPF